MALINQTFPLCPSGWSRYSDINVFEECDVPVKVLEIIRFISIAISILLGTIQCLIVVIKRHQIIEKRRVPIIIILWTTLQSLIMSIRPSVLYTTNLMTRRSLIMGLITYLSAASVAGIAVFFIYIQSRLLQRSAIRKKVPTIFKHKKMILLTAGIGQALIFFIGPFLNVYTYIPANITFWIPVILVDFIVIPYFCYLGFRVYLRVSESNKKLAKKIIMIVLICSSLSLCTGGMAILGTTRSLFFDWILIELTWPIATIFSTAIFFIFSKKSGRSKGVIHSSADITSTKNKSSSKSNNPSNTSNSSESINNDSSTIDV